MAKDRILTASHRTLTLLFMVSGILILLVECKSARNILGSDVPHQRQTDLSGNNLEVNPEKPSTPNIVSTYFWGPLSYSLSSTAPNDEIKDEDAETEWNNDVELDDYDDLAAKIRLRLSLKTRDKIVYISVAVMGVALLGCCAIVLWCLFFSPRAQRRRTYTPIPTEAPPPLTPESAVAYLAQDPKGTDPPKAQTSKSTFERSSTPPSIHGISPTAAERTHTRAAQSGSKTEAEPTSDVDKIFDHPATATKNTSSTPPDATEYPSFINVGPSAPVEEPALPTSAPDSKKDDTITSDKNNPLQSVQKLFEQFT